jgi:predicted pyridoxine 5'-phosphate oxidase superfamily flavin-nucleotide-binding protein
MESFADLMFTDAVAQVQEARGSRDQYAAPYRRIDIGPDEKLFIETRTSFYLATVNSDGWPYVQHRGGPQGFLKVLDNETLAFADYPGNRQYVSTGNLAEEARVSLFLMDYPRRARLKILGRAEVVAAKDDPFLLEQLSSPGAVTPSHIFKVKLAALDWNCPKYITPRFSEDELDQIIGPQMRAMAARIKELEAALATQDPAAQDPATKDNT